MDDMKAGRWFREQPHRTPVRRGFVNEGIDRPNWIVPIDPILQTFGKQRRLPPIDPLNEAPHPIPPLKSGGIIQRESNNRVRFYTARVKVRPSGLSATSPLIPQYQTLEGTGRMAASVIAAVVSFYSSAPMRLEDWNNHQSIRLCLERARGLATYCRARLRLNHFHCAQ